MFKTFVSALAVGAVLSLAAAAPASAWERHHGGFGFRALAGGAIGAVIGAEILSHSTHDYYRAEGPVAPATDEVVRVCPPGTHLGPYRHYCWAN